jgi:hypothetical protein
MPVTSLLDHFMDEVQEHLSQRKCPFKNSQKDISGEGVRA